MQFLAVSGKTFSSLCFLLRFSKYVFSEELLPNVTYNHNGQNAVVLLVWRKIRGRGGDQIIRGLNTIYSYSGLGGLPPRWKENVPIFAFLYYVVTLLRFVSISLSALTVLSFLFQMFLWKDYNRKSKMRQYRIIFRTQSSDQQMDISENDLGRFSVGKITYFATKPLCSIPWILKFDSKPTKLCSDVMQRKVSKILCSDASTQNGPVSS